MAKKKKKASDKLTIVSNTDALEFKALFINKVRLRITKGRSTAELAPNVSHSLKWSVLGATGAKWSWQLEAPDGMAIDPAELEEQQDEELEAPNDSPEAVSFRIVEKTEGAKDKK